jgi:hypothetical protein
MSVQKRHKKISMIERLVQLFEQGFFVEVGRYSDTPIGQGDQLLGMDVYGHVLIARAPIASKTSDI